MLRSRCGDDQDTSQPSQNISIVVSDPQRTRQGLSMIISYTIATIVRQDRRYFGGPNDEDNIKEYSVTRSHSNIKSLYKCLIREYRKSGVIVPPPPKGLSKVDIRLIDIGFISNVILYLVIIIYINQWNNLSFFRSQHLPRSQFIAAKVYPPLQPWSWIGDVWH